jgi:hypothetical protein
MHTTLVTGNPVGITMAGIALTAGLIGMRAAQRNVFIKCNYHY